MTEETQALTLVTAIRDGLRVQSNAVKNERSARARRAGRRAARHAGALDALLAALTTFSRDLAAARQERDAALKQRNAFDRECKRLREQARQVAGNQPAETLRELRAEIAEAKTGLYGEVSGVRALEIIDSKLAAREGQ